MIDLIGKISEHKLWLLKWHLKASGNLALAGGCGLGLLYLQSTGVEIPLWAVATIWLSSVVLVLKGLLNLKVYFDDAISDPEIEPRSTFLIAVATVLLLPAIGGISFVVILRLIRG